MIPDRCDTIDTSVAMSISAAMKRTSATAWQYIRVTKPRESSLLVFIGFCAMVVAGDGLPSTGRLLLTLAAITLGSGGVNGLTNYLDRGPGAGAVIPCRGQACSEHSAAQSSSSSSSWR